MTPPISDKAVEAWAREKHLYSWPQWEGIGWARKAGLLASARRDLTAILPLLCGGLEEERDRLLKERGDEWRGRADVLRDRAGRAEQELEQVRVERDTFERRHQKAVDAHHDSEITLNQVREEVERLRGAAKVAARNEAAARGNGLAADPDAAARCHVKKVTCDATADRLQAILDSSSSVSGEPCACAPEGPVAKDCIEKGCRESRGVPNLAPEGTELPRFRLELIRGADGDKALHPHPQGEWVPFEAASQQSSTTSNSLSDAFRELRENDEAVARIGRAINCATVSDHPRHPRARNAIDAVFAYLVANGNSLSREPGDRELGVERAARKFESEAAEARKAAASTNDPQAKAAHNGRAQLLAWSANRLRTIAYPQPLSPQVDPSQLASPDTDATSEAKTCLSGDGERLEAAAASLEVAVNLASEQKLPATARVWSERAESLRDLATRLSEGGLRERERIRAVFEKKMAALDLNEPRAREKRNWWKQALAALDHPKLQDEEEWPVRCSACDREAVAEKELGSICAFVRPGRVQTCQGVLIRREPDQCGGSGEGR